MRQRNLLLILFMAVLSLVLTTPISACAFGSGETMRTQRGPSGSYYVRSGRFAGTGDIYRYFSNSLRIEISPSKRYQPGARVVRARWLGGCSVDAMSDRSKCRINVLDPRGLVSGGLELQVNSAGNIVVACVIGHDFPGRIAQVRIDKNPALSTNANGCLSGASARAIQSQLSGGKTLITRRIEWPYEYHRDTVFDVADGWRQAHAFFRYRNSEAAARSFAK